MYGPNTDQPEFYSYLKSEIENTYSNQYIIMTGGFNVLMYKGLDTMNDKKLNYPKAQHEFQNIMNF